MKSSTASGLIKLCRPRQWPKNLLVLAVPLASKDILDFEVLRQSLIAAIAFVFVSSSVYVWNDLRDVNLDKLNPLKASRPLASGAVGEWHAYVLGSALFACGISITARWSSQGFLGTLVAYCVIQFCYQLWFKNIALLDIASVSSGFVLRAMAGGAAADIPISFWFMSITGSVALFVISAKRFSEFRASGQDFGARKVLAQYSEGYLRMVWASSLTISVIFYMLWSAEKDLVDASSVSRASVIPFTLVLLKYAMYVDRGLAEEPERIIITDRFIQAFAFSWLVLFLL